LAAKPDGLLLSNGPGDPADNVEIISNIQKLIGKLPIMGICMGHQLLALGCGVPCRKMVYGHRGINQAVKNTDNGKVFITSQNHGYEIDENRLDGKAEVSFRSVNDKSVEGLKYKAHPSFSVQFHPEACPGPVDTMYLFDDFNKMMEDFQNAKK
jgi:carbamoyl-phosphate synthase small subunit